MDSKAYCHGLVLLRVWDYQGWGVQLALPSVRALKKQAGFRMIFVAGFCAVGVWEDHVQIVLRNFQISHS